MADIFLKLDGIPGESMDADHEDWIEVRGIAGGVDEGNRAEDVSLNVPPNVHDLSMTKMMDRASPALFEAICRGRVMEEATVEFCRPAGDRRLCFLTLALTGVRISSFQFSGSSSDTIPVEQFSLGFEKITWKYVQQRHDGSPGGVVSSSWNLKT